MTRKFLPFFVALFFLRYADHSSEKKSNENLDRIHDASYKAGGAKKSDEEILIEKEKNYTETLIQNPGKQITTISFKVKTTDKDYEDGLIPYASLEKPDEDLKNLVDKNELVIKESKVTMIIDYPLTNPCRFELESDKGFTRGQLLKVISKKYFEIYEEEEKSSRVKTVPVDKRKTLYNRNETKGKYGIWGHDIADLVLSEIEVFKTTSGELILTLNIES